MILLRAILLLLLFVAESQAALSVIQTKISSRAAGADSLGRTFDSTVTAGSLLVQHCATFNGGGSGVPTFSDNINSTWGAPSSTGYATSGDADSEIYLASFPNSASGTITVTCNPPGATADIDVTGLEVGGAATSSARDKSVTNTGTVTVGEPASFTASVVAGVLTQAAEFMISSSSHTSGDSTSIDHDSTDGFSEADANNVNSGGQTFHVQYKITAATTSLTVNTVWNRIGPASATWFAGVASFLEAPPGASCDGSPAYYQLEDGSGNYQLEDGSGAYLCEGATGVVVVPTLTLMGVGT